MLDTTFIERCILTLEKALDLLKNSDQEEISYDMYRSACVKVFEIILEQAGKLLKKTLRPYYSSSSEIDKLVFKDIFRNSAKHGIMSINEVDRWMKYRDNRNTTTHDYGIGFAEETLVLLPQFILDAKSLVKSINDSDVTKS